MTGLAPADNGKLNNDWQPGAPRVTKATLFDDARQRGFRSAFHYARTKLGYLASAAVDEHGLERDAGIDKALAPLFDSSNLAHIPPVPRGRWNITGPRSMVRGFLGLM